MRGTRKHNLNGAPVERCLRWDEVGVVVQKSWEAMSRSYGRVPLPNGKISRYLVYRSSKELLLRTHRAAIGLIHEIVSKI